MSHSSQSNTKRPKVLLLGSNPSIKSASDLAFFLDSKSGKTLREWIAGIQADFIYGNVSSIKTENNRPLTRREVKASLPDLLKTIAKDSPDRIVALGKTAHEALTLLQLPHLQMPHPSGMNRQLNDKNFKEQKIKELAAFCTASSVLEEN